VKASNALVGGSKRPSWVAEGFKRPSCEAGGIKRLVGWLKASNVLVRWLEASNALLNSAVRALSDCMGDVAASPQPAMRRVGGGAYAQVLCLPGVC
jgi:hypothetical protein